MLVPVGRVCRVCPSGSADLSADRDGVYYLPEFGEDKLSSPYFFLTSETVNSDQTKPK